MTDESIPAHHRVQSQEHALVAGMVLGTLLKYGLNAEPEMDDEGNYLASIVLVFPERGSDRRVRLIVERIEERTI